MAKCVLCDERGAEIKRILKAYKRDKRFYWKVIIVQAVILLMISLYGAGGLEIGLKILKGFLK